MIENQASSGLRMHGQRTDPATGESPHANSELLELCSERNLRNVLARTRKRQDSNAHETYRVRENIWRPKRISGKKWVLRPSAELCLK